jgi:hypothetical protein
MTPTFAIKKRVRYWYLLSLPLCIRVGRKRPDRFDALGEAVERIILDSIGALPSIREILPARTASAKLPRSERDAHAPDAAERIAANVDRTLQLSVDRNLSFKVLTGPKK